MTWLTYLFSDVCVKSEDMNSEVVITKAMEEEEKQLMEEGERKEKEMMEKVCCLIPQNLCVLLPFSPQKLCL